MASMQIELLGAFRLCDAAGSEIPVRSVKLRALIAYLALHRDQPVKRETLAGRLWGDSSDGQARQSLRQALHSLRRSLGDSASAIDADDETVLLRGAAARVDVALFEEAVKEGRLSEAVALYRGDLLVEPSLRAESFEGWLEQERTRLRDLACAALEAYIESLLRAGDAGTAVQAGRQIEALDPWRETGTRLLMKAYAQAGRRAEALQHYRAFAETLERELGAQPDAETTRLFEEMRDGVIPPQTESGKHESGDRAAEQDRPGEQESTAAKGSRTWRWAAAVTLVIGVLVGWAGWDNFQRGSRPGPESSPDGISRETLADKPSIAVLPFLNLSGDPEQEYFADGMSEDIMNELSKFGYFFVISRNSTFSYKGTAVPVKELARELGVEYVLEGSVRKVGNRVRITAQLIDAKIDKHVWAERYDRELKDVFQVQDEITESIVASVAPEYLSAELQRAQAQDAPNLEAWDTFMRGYWHYLRYTKDDNETAQRLIRRALELDPGRANYHAVLAVTHLLDGLYGWSPSRDESLRTALEIAERGLALDDQDAQVVRVPGLIHFFSRRYAAARSYYERAVATNPYEAENHALLGAAFGVDGEYDAALSAFETAFRLSPRDVHAPTWYNYLAVAAFIVGRDEEAAEWARKTIEANPQFPGGHRTLAAANGAMERTEEAERAAGKLLELLPHLTIKQLRQSIPYFKDPDGLERYLDGLRWAGIPEG